MNPFAFATLILLTCGMATPQSARAQPPFEPRLLYVQGGALSYNVARDSVFPSGKAGLLGPLMVSFGSTVHLGLTPVFYLEPSLFLTPFGRRSFDDALTVRVLNISLRSGVRLGPVLFSAGPGYWIQWMKGPGGTVVLSNGTSSKEFALPGRSLLARTLFVDVAAGGVFGPLRLDAAAWILAPFTKRREMTLALHLGYGFL